jgi:hypothetical protein
MTLILIALRYINLGVKESHHETTNRLFMYDVSPEGKPVRS